MGYSLVALEDKIRELYPEIDQFGLSTTFKFDHDRNVWEITFLKGNHKRSALLEKKDADTCMDGQACIYLSTLLDQYLKDLEDEIEVEAA